MKDTKPSTQERYRELILGKSGSERLAMGAAMFEDAKGQVMAGLRASSPNLDGAELKRRLFLRFYGSDFSAKKLEKILRGLFLLLLASAPFAAASEPWPDLSEPPKASGGGEKDAAVIVGAENYFAVDHVVGAKQNAEDWQAYLTETLKVPSERVALLRDNDATLEEMRKAAAEKASEVEPGGTVWFVFIGHGAPSKDGKDGLLVGIDAQQKAESLYARSLPRGELLSALSKGRQAKTVVLVDACFSGRTSSGQELVKGLQQLVLVVDKPRGLDDRTVLLTAAKSDQFAGSLPKSSRQRPAFSYLALGALRGWAADGSGSVTAGAVVRFAEKALKLAHDRTQTPELAAGSPASVLGKGREAAPDLAKIDRVETAAGPDFQVTNLPAVPKAQAPGALDRNGSGLDWSTIDVDALEKYNAVLKVDKGDAGPGEKSEAWRRLAKDEPKYAPLAEKRAAEWDRYGAERKADEEAKAKRAAARDADWEKLSRLLALDSEVVPDANKTKWAQRFVEAYLELPGLDPATVGALARHLPDGRQKEALKDFCGPGHAALFSKANGCPADVRSLVFESPFAYQIMNEDGIWLVPVGAGLKWDMVFHQDTKKVEFAVYSSKDPFYVMPESLPASAILRSAKMSGGAGAAETIVRNGGIQVIPTAAGFEIFEAKSISKSPARQAPSGGGGIEWITIPGGTFMMGGGDYDFLKPRRSVSVKSFQLAKSLVTNKQYHACVAAGGCTPPDHGCLEPRFAGDDQPVVCVNWRQAKEFSDWAGGRLPSEAEWEFAARSGGKDWKYPWGDEEVSCDRAVIDPLIKNAKVNGCGRDATWPVCSKPAGNSAQGLCDMIGNASEWIEDWSHDSYLGAPSDGTAWDAPEQSQRVVRGSDWAAQAGSSYAAFRNQLVPAERRSDLGFRPARSIQGE